MFLPGRMSAFVPLNTVATAAMIAARSPVGIVASQWANQTANSVSNYVNRSGASIDMCAGRRAALPAEGKVTRPPSTPPRRAGEMAGCGARGVAARAARPVTDVTATAPSCRRPARLAPPTPASEACAERLECARRPARTPGVRLAGAIFAPRQCDLATRRREIGWSHSERPAGPRRLRAGWVRPGGGPVSRHAPSRRQGRVCGAVMVARTR